MGIEIKCQFCDDEGCGVCGCNARKYLGHCDRPQTEQEKLIHFQADQINKLEKENEALKLELTALKKLEQERWKSASKAFGIGQNKI
jgi:hypothetical protein